MSSARLPTIFSIWFLLPLPSAVAQFSERISGLECVATVSSVVLERYFMVARFDHVRDRALRVLDAIDANVAVLDSQGFIIQTNKAWDDFAANNGWVARSHSKSVGVGTNYLSVCRGSEGPSADNALRASRGIQDVLEGKRRVFSLEYPCHSPDKQRWFTMRASALRGIKPKEVVVAHHDITAQRIAQLDAFSKQHKLAIALAQLQNLARSIQDSVTMAHPRGPESLRSSFPQLDDRDTRSSESGRSRSLSMREKEVLAALVRGERNVDISERLKLSAKSVSTYRTRILEKLNLRNNAELVAAVARRSLNE